MAFEKKWNGPPNPRPIPKPRIDRQEETPTIGTIFIDQKKNRLVLKSMGEDIDLGPVGDFDEIAKNLSAHIAKKMLEGVK
jgi:hypothetical protein